jgi:hypothetical protein
LSFSPAGRSVRDYVSPSWLNLWLKCPLAWKFKYLDGIWTPASPAMFLGRRVHRGLELHYRHRQLGLVLDAEEILRRVDESWEEAVEAEAVAFSSGDEEQKARQQTAELLRAYLKQIPADEPRPLAVETAAEAPLVDAGGEDLGIPMVGVIDLLLDRHDGRDDGRDGPLIVDFKTSSRSAPPMEITHEVQLGCYAWLYRRVTGQTEGGLEIRSLIRTKSLSQKGSGPLRVLCGARTCDVN